MYYAGIDAHATYLMVTVVDQTGTRVLAPTRVPVCRSEQLLETLQPFSPTVMDKKLPNISREVSAGEDKLHRCLLPSAWTEIGEVSQHTLRAWLRKPAALLRRGHSGLELLLR